MFKVGNYFSTSVGYRMLIQVKGNYETVGVSGEVEVGDCVAQQVHEKTNTISMVRQIQRQIQNQGVMNI